MQIVKQLLSAGVLGCGLLLAIVNTALASEEISITSADDLLITADLYAPYALKTAPLIVLFHQAGSSRGEYIDIAPELNKLGFNCIAVDLRSGEYSRGKDNKTAMRASEAKLGMSYVDAMPDMIAALQYARKKYGANKIIAWGSSYSAALVIRLAGDKPQLVDGVLAFSPGEYFSRLGKSNTWIRDAAANIKVPVFISSSSSEGETWLPIYKAIHADTKQSYLPKTGGRHGSKALWKKYPDSEIYWDNVVSFLKSNYLK